MSARRRVALVSAASAMHLDDDLSPLIDALTARDAEPLVVDWCDPSVDWASFDLAVLRSTWDYTWKLDAFLEWAATVESVTTLANPLDVVRWSADKRYLPQLATLGVPVVPTAVLEPDPAASAAGTSAAGNEWERALAAIDPAADVVVKPVVSAGGRDTERFGPGSRSAAAAHAEALLGGGRAVLVQPYLDAVDAHGETGIVYLGNKRSHAFNKGALLDGNDTMVESLYREERITAAVATPDMVAVAEAALDAVALCVPGRSRHDLLYARVDVAPSPTGPVVLELELVEPSLYLATDPASPARAAAAILAALP